MKQILKRYGGRLFNWFIVGSGLAENPDEVSESVLLWVFIGILINVASLHLFPNQFLQLLFTVTLGVLFLISFFFMFVTSLLTSPAGQKYREELLSDTDQATLPNFDD